MQVIKISDDIVINGLSVRTKNLDEMNSSTAKIGPLWHKFFTEIAPNLKNGSKVYGLYSNYQSDASGEFDVTAGTDQKIDKLNNIQVKKGKYLVFSAKGSMPQVVINVWEEIWNYFSPTNQENQYERTYLTDIELYKSDNEVEIYIGIK